MNPAIPHAATAPECLSPAVVIQPAGQRASPPFGVLARCRGIEPGHAQIWPIGGATGCPLVADDSAFFVQLPGEYWSKSPLAMSARGLRMALANRR